MARGIHGLPKVSAGPAMPNPSTPSGRATPKTALRPFRGWPARRMGGLKPSSTPLDTPRRTGLFPITPHSSSVRLMLVFSPGPYGKAVWGVARPQGV
jgi:hypothetical protein